MRAAVYHGNRDLRLEQVDDPTPGEGEVVLRIHAAGICGTDAAEFASGPTMYPIEVRHPVTGHVGPMVPGHELAGRVVATGPGATGLEEGALVVSGAGISCGECTFCRQGRTNLCERYSTVGLQRNGALAEYCAVPVSTCLAVDDLGLTGDTAAMAQPVAIAVHAMRQGRPRPGDSAVVIGAGGVGAFLVFALAQLGVRVVVADLDEHRLEIARRLGADQLLRPAQPDLLGDELAEVAGEPQVAYEVTGSASGVAAAVRSVQRGGTVVAVGLHGAPRPVNLRDVTLRELTVVGTSAHVCRDDLPTALQLLSQRADSWDDVAPVAIGLDELLDDGIEPLVNGSSTRIKTLVDPWVSHTRTADHG